MARLEGVTRGIKMSQAKKAVKVPKRLPITLVILKGLFPHIVRSSPADHDQLIIWAAACICFYGFFRAGEITVPSDAAFDPTAHMCFEDVSLDSVVNPQCLTLHLKSSKTDPFRKGVDVAIGRSRGQACPIVALLAFLAKRGNNPGFLFRFADGRLLTKQRFIDKVREALQAAGLNPNQFAGHSFRIGAATTAAASGFSDSTIKLLGRWESTAYQTYIQTPRDKLAKFTASLGQS